MAPWDMYRAPAGDDDGLEVKDGRSWYLNLKARPDGNEWKIMKICELCDSEAYSSARESRRSLAFAAKRSNHNTACNKKNPDERRATRSERRTEAKTKRKRHDLC